MLVADLYFSIRSPFSYLAIQQLDRLLQNHIPVVEIRLKPVMPIAVRKPELFTRMNALEMPYLAMDARRTAEKEGIDIRVWPVPDPIVQDMTSLEIAAEQPYIWRLTRLLQCSVEQGKGFEFALCLSRLIWGGTVDGWHEGDHLKQAAASVGLCLSEMDADIEANAGDYDRKVFANQDALAAAGHWGVPTIVFEGEPFYDQDRVEVFLWRLQQKQ
jgi:2-hydroxychromene-2-carboxylate isomerase